MATVLGSLLMGNVLPKSAAEKTFHPWWDVLEDYLVYGLVLVGLLLVPQAIVSGSPLNCNYCQQDYCSQYCNHATNATLKHCGNGTQYVNRNGSGYSKDPGFSAWWVKNYCTYNAEDEKVKSINNMLDRYIMQTFRESLL